MPARTTQSLGVMPPAVYLSKFIFLLEKFYRFSLLEVPVVLGFTFFLYLFFFFFFFEFIQVQFSRPSLWTHKNTMTFIWL